MDVDRYLARLDLGSRRPEPTLDGLARLQSAHVTTVPFETLAITGHPVDDRAGAGVSLEPAHLYRKIVRDERGGFCYELNGLFGRLLERVGFDVDHLAGASSTTASRDRPQTT